MDASPLLVLVVAIAENGVIGNAGELPWRLSSDLKRFRKLTMGKPMVMGRKTFASIGKALDGRDNIVVSRDRAFEPEGVLVANDMESALEIARECARARHVGEIAIIGGEQVFRDTLPLADRIELTRVHASPQGDTFFPELDKRDWKETSCERHSAGSGDSADYSFVRLERRSPGPGSGSRS
jgi:dihydrofolate reductase